jgi:hypothetical protein
VTTADPTPVPGSWRLSLQELAERAGATVEQLERLVELGILEPANSDEPFRSGDILRVRAVAALEGSGVQPEQIAAAMAAGELSFGYLDYVLQPRPVIDRRYSEAADDLGIPFDVVERVFLAFGLLQPPPNEQAREDGALVLRGLKAFLDAIDEVDVLGTARIFGDALRRLAEYQMHLFHTRVEERFRKAGVPETLVLDTALKEVGVYTSPLGELFAAWLYRRHSENFTLEHRVLHGEDDLERAGIHRRAAADPPAIVFLDISGYTRLTEDLGDEASAAMPMRLAALVQDAVSRYSGRTVKVDRGRRRALLSSTARCRPMLARASRSHPGCGPACHAHRNQRGIGRVRERGFLRKDGEHRGPDRRVRRTRASPRERGSRVPRGK